MYRKVWKEEILSFLPLTSIPSHQNKVAGIHFCGLLKGQLKLEWGECEKGQECTLLLSNRWLKVRVGKRELFILVLRSKAGHPLPGYNGSQHFIWICLRLLRESLQDHCDHLNNQWK